MPSASTHREEQREGGGDEPQHATECCRDAYFCRLMQKHHLEFLDKKQIGFFSWTVDYCKSSFMIHVSTYFTIQHNFYDFGGIYEVIRTKKLVIKLDDIQTTSQSQDTNFTTRSVELCLSYQIAKLENNLKVQYVQIVVKTINNVLKLGIKRNVKK